MSMAWKYLGQVGGEYGFADMFYSIGNLSDDLAADVEWSLLYRAPRFQSMIAQAGFDPLNGKMCDVELYPGGYRDVLFAPAGTASPPDGQRYPL